MHVPWRCLFYVLKQKKKAFKLGLCHCTDQASLKESFVFPVVCTLPILFMLWLTNTYIPTCVLCFLVNLTVTPPNFLWVMSGWLVRFWAPQLLTATTPNSFCWTPSGCLVLYLGSSTCLLAARAPPFLYLLSQVTVLFADVQSQLLLQSLNYHSTWLFVGHRLMACIF